MNDNTKAKIVATIINLQDGEDELFDLIANKEIDQAQKESIETAIREIHEAKYHLEKIVDY
jgi:hypothetical protein